MGECEHDFSAFFRRLRKDCSVNGESAVWLLSVDIVERLSEKTLVSYEFAEILTSPFASSVGSRFRKNLTADMAEILKSSTIFSNIFWSSSDSEHGIYTQG